MNHSPTDQLTTEHPVQPPRPARPAESRAGIRSFVEAQVERTPEAVAAIFGDRTISYRELESRANQLANYLIAQGIGPDRLVGICFPRSIEMIVALVAVFKAGGGYVSLDPNHPGERLAFMVADSRPAAILTHSTLIKWLPPKNGARVICLDAESEEISAASEEPPAPAPDGDHLAYLIYTSGSTGNAKAVAMPQRVLYHLLEWQLANWTLPAAARTLQFTSLNFDVAFQEIFSTLSAGGTLVLTSEDQRREPAELLRVMRDYQVERLFLPFVALQQLAKAFETERIVPSNLRDVITAGEQLQITPHVKSLFEHLPGCKLHNQYGPAESHIIVTAYTLDGEPAAWPLLPPIGKPIAKVRIYLLDEHKKRVPSGQTGEIYIGGAALARGYLNREQLTAERFIRDPFCDEPGARIYQTGDLGTLLPDGNIQYLGRRDQQVKIRGVRVELGEVEAVLSEHPLVEHAVAVASESAIGEKRLIAYFVPKPSAAPLPRDLRDFLAAKLPAHSVPSAYVAIDAIPLTPTGKVDRLALPAPTSDRSGEDVVAPRTPVEETIVAIWERCLNVRPVGIRDNFFHLGGDSLVAIQISAEIEIKLQKTVPLAWTFSASTVEELAAHLLDTPHGPDAESIIGINTGGSRRPFFCICGYFDIARYLGDDQPFYKVDLKRLEHITDPNSAIRTMASQCIAEIRSVQPEGPYLLGGHSLGSVVAFEMARQLREAGQTIALLALLDPDRPLPSTFGALRRAIGRTASYLKHLFSLSPREQARRMLASGRFYWNKLKVRRAASRDFSAIPRHDKALALEGSYRPQPYPGRVTLFLAGDVHAGAQSSSDPRLDWGRLATGGAEVHVIPGDHETLLREPNVRILGKLLRGHLEAAMGLMLGALCIGSF